MFKCSPSIIEEHLNAKNDMLTFLKSVFSDKVMWIKLPCTTHSEQVFCVIIPKIKVQTYSYIHVIVNSLIWGCQASSSCQKQYHFALCLWIQDSNLEVMLYLGTLNSSQIEARKFKLCTSGKISTAHSYLFVITNVSFCDEKRRRILLDMD